MRCPSVRRKLSHLRLLLWILLIGSKISTSTKFVFFGPIGKPKCPPWPLIGWDIFDFSETATYGIQRNLTGSKISTSSTKFVFFGPIGKTISRPWPLICWDIFDFSSETAERNSMKVPFLLTFYVQNLGSRRKTWRHYSIVLNIHTYINMYIIKKIISCIFIICWDITALIKLKWKFAGYI